MTDPWVIDQMRLITGFTQQDSRYPIPIGTAVATAIGLNYMMLTHDGIGDYMSCLFCRLQR